MKKIFLSRFLFIVKYFTKVDNIQINERKKRVKMGLINNSETNQIGEGRE